MNSYLIPSLIFTLAASSAAAQQGSAGRLLDLNGDGAVGRSELEQVARERFAATDADKDGVLSVDELLFLLLAKFDALDTDKDGLVTRREVIQGAADGTFQIR
ncbi:MAG: hypothetical protein HXY22_07640 [Alphaproteobacteria bacterium]|nr:hypothetical protein [Alphaproteobacteria bacterium]